MARAARSPYGDIGRALALALLSTGCLGGQTGQESEVHEPDPCEDAGSRPFGLAGETPAGWRARDIVGETGTYEDRSLEWYRPEPGSTQVRIAYSLDLDSVRLRSSSTCTGRVDIDAVVELHTTDRKLRDEFAGTLELAAEGNATFSAALPVGALQGTLDAAEGLDPDLFADPQLRLQLWLTGSEVHGQLTIDGRDRRPNDDTSPVSPFVGAF